MTSIIERDIILNKSYHKKGVIMRNTKKLLVAIGLAFAVLVSSMPIQNADGKQIVAQAATIKLSRKTINLKVGETANLKVSGTKKKVKWSSGNKYVVSVTKKGKVLAVGEGTAYVKAKIGKKSLSCKVTVVSSFNASQAKKNISIELTNNCNLHCVHCCVEAGEKRKKDLSTEEIIDIFNKCISWNPKMITLSGGEPLLRKDFKELLVYLRSNYNGHIGVSTNGTLITNSNADLLVKYADQIDISIDGVDEETCSIVRGKGVFENVIRNIKVLQDKGFNNVSLSMVFSDKNEYLEPAFLELNRQLGTTPITRVFAEIGRGKDSKNIFSDKGIDDVYIPETFLDLNSKQQLGVRTCSAGRNQLFVRYNGEVYPCPSYMKREYCLGNILKVQKIDELLVDSEGKKDIQELMLKTDMLYGKKCANCELSLFCWTCPGEAYNLKSEAALEKYCETCKPMLLHKIWGE
mgnify:CR=1 FL=1